jgi:hypothetical protein
MSNLNSLLESSNQWKSMQSDSARLASKWGRTGLLEGLKNETEKNNMSLILENQAKQLVIESSNTGGGAGAGTFTAGTGGQWAGVALPLVRKVFGQIAAKDFVSVQPMSLPSGLVFFLDFQYGGGKALQAGADVDLGKFKTGSGVFGDSSVYGVTNTTGAPTDGLYGAGKWTYSTNASASKVAADPHTSHAAGKVFTASWQDVGYDSTLSASVASGHIKALTIATSSLPNVDLNAAQALFVSGTNITSNHAAYNVLNDKVTDNFTIFYSSSAAGPTSDIAYVSYPMSPTDSNRGDFEDGNTALNPENATIDIPEINVKLKSEAIVAKTKKLKAVWTPEFAQDLNAYHSLDAEAELTSIMSEYISLEIDLEIMGMLMDNALTTEYWSAQNNRVVENNTLTVDPYGYYNTQGQWFQTLGTKINKVSNKIHQLTLRGGANFLVCSPTVATILESIPGYAADNGASADDMSYAFGIQKVGALNSKYQVYKNPYMTENAILLGFKGSQFLETGATFAPYIPLIMTPLVYDPDTFTPRKGLLTRYAKKMLRPEYYAKIYVNGLNTL